MKSGSNSKANVVIVHYGAPKMQEYRQQEQKSKSRSNGAIAIKFGDTASNDQFRFTLINYVKENRILWDSSHPKYKDLNEKQRIWSQFIDIFYPEEEFTVEGLKKTWKSLYDCFIRENKKTQNSLESGDPNNEDEAKIKWKYYDVLTFLKDPSQCVQSDEFTVPVSPNGEVTNDESYNIDDSIRLRQQTVKPILKFGQRKRIFSEQSNLVKRFRKPNTIQPQTKLNKTLNDLGASIIGTFNKNSDDSVVIDTFKLVSEMNPKLDILIKKCERIDDDNLNFAMSVADSLKLVQNTKKLTALKANIWQLIAEAIDD